MSKTIDWEPIKTDYFRENLCADRNSPLTLKELSLRWHVSYRSLRNRSSIDRWNDELKDRIAAKNRKCIDLAQEREAINEIEVRTRQAVAAREMLEMALSKLRTIRPQDLSKKEAIELLKIGLTEERRALGLADRFELKAQVNNQDRFSPVEEMIKGHNQVEVLALRILSSIGKN